MRLRPRLRPQLLATPTRIDLCLQLRHLKHRTALAPQRGPERGQQRRRPLLLLLPPCPVSRRRPRAPLQRAHPRLHVVAQVQRAVAQSGDARCRRRDLVFGLLVREAQDPLRGAVGVWFRIVVVGPLLILGSGFLPGILARALGVFGRARVDVGVGVPGLDGGGDDGVPDYGFGVGGPGGFFGGGRGGKDGGYVDEDLFRVPGEEG